MVVDWALLAGQFASSAKYREDWKGAHLALSQLCNYIRASHMGDALFGFTSHHVLSISQTSFTFPPDPSLQWLRIQPLADDVVEFRFVDTQIKNRQWSRTVSADQVIQRFKSAIEQLGWSTVPLA